MPNEVLDRISANLWDGEEEGCNFFAVRNYLRAVAPSSYALWFAEEYFGAFGAGVLALSDKVALRYPEGVLNVERFGDKIYILRLESRTLCLHTIDMSYHVKLKEFKEDICNLNQLGASRLKVTDTTIYVAFGRHRFCVSTSKVKSTTVTPKTRRGVRTRALKSLGNGKNNGKNVFVRSFPSGHNKTPYFVFAMGRDQQNPAVQLKLAVYAAKTRVFSDRESLFATFYHRFNFDGNAISHLLWICQAHAWRPYSVSKRKFLMTQLGETVRWGLSTPWRVVAGARLFNYVFMTITRELENKGAAVTETVSGVVCLPASGDFMRITEVIPYDARFIEPVSDEFLGLFIFNLLGVSDDLLSQGSDKYFNGHCYVKE